MYDVLPQEHHEDGSDDSEDPTPDESLSLARCSFRRPGAHLGRRNSSARHNHSAKERTYVDHTYSDHARDPLLGGEGDGTVGVESKKTPRGGVTIAFPERLHLMLSVATQQDFDDVISWQPHGRCFLIQQKQAFVKDIMPRFFSQTKLTSFQRQLNLYGFVRLTAGCDRGSYYHELFIRGRPDLCRRMVRTRVKGNGMKAAASPQTEPNFYTMEYCYDDADGTVEKILPQPIKVEEQAEEHAEDHEEEKVASTLMEQDDDDDDDISMVITSVEEATEQQAFLPIVTPANSYERSSIKVPSMLDWPDNLIMPLMDDRVESSSKDVGVTMTMSLASMMSPSLLQRSSVAQQREEQEAFRAAIQQQAELVHDDFYDDIDFTFSQSDDLLFEGLKLRALDLPEPETRLSTMMGGEHVTFV